MLYTATVTPLVLLVSAALTLSGLGAPVAVEHLAFAVGIVPLIFAAIGHFVPVLTRSGNPPRRIALLPPIAQAGGLLAVLSMQGWAPGWCLHLAATVDLLLAATLLIWIVGRARRCIGSPHPGWRWYGVALACFVLALAAVLGLLMAPGWHLPLRAFHLHLNLLGLVGMAALGTLPVLMPTALARPDPDAAAWLRHDLWPAAGSVLTIAMGAGFGNGFLASVGATLLLAVTFSLGRQWWRRFGALALWRDGVAVSLGAALAGLFLLLAAGVAHWRGMVEARSLIAVWMAGFLLPLVSGALSQLLPVWRWPGPVIPARGQMRARLAATGRWRALLFLAAAGAILARFPDLAGGLAVAGLILFVFDLVRAMRVSATT